MKRQKRKKKAASPAKANVTTPRRTTTKASKPAVNTSNTYAVLTDNDEENIVDNVNSKKPKAIKIPPIICVDSKYDSTTNPMKKAKIENFSLKYISMEIKIFCATLDDFNKVRRQLEKDQIQHFTHDVASSKSQKFVLSGLPYFPTEEVKTALQQEHLDVIDVKKMKTTPYSLYISTTTVQLFRVYARSNTS